MTALGDINRSVQSPSAAHMRIDGRDILNFGGSCYLGLGSLPALTEAGAATLRRGGAASQLPRHYGFALEANVDAEAEARRYFGTQAAIFYATGYMFGLSVLPGLAGDYDVAIIDESGHFSLHEGALIAGKPIYTFRHCDADDLAVVLAKAAANGKRPLVATDGMFATFGAIPPLDAYARLLAPYDGWLIVDESHSMGVLGETGRGAAEKFNVAGPRTIAGGSLGKALSAYGGITVGAAQPLAKIYQSPAMRGAAAGMSAGAAMAAAAMRELAANPDHLRRLRANTAALKAGLADLGLPVTPNEAPIASFTLDSAEHTQAVCAALWDAGIYVILSDYIGAGPNGVIRIAAFADHRPDDFKRLFAALGPALLKKAA